MADPVYWIGQDGNIYYGSGVEGAPVQNLGSSTNGQYLAQNNGLYDKYTDTGTPSLIYSATQIADPNAAPSQVPAPTGGSGTAKVFNQAGADLTQKTIDQIPGLLEAALAAEATNHTNAVNGFNASEDVQRGLYDTNTTTNQQNYDRTFMDAIRAGIKGLGGVLALLRGTGGGGGTAEKLARDAVAGTTANDIRTGADTQKENQASLDSSLNSFLTDLKQKRQAAEDTFVNNQRSIRRDSNTELQDLYKTMAGFFGDVGNTAAATDWMNKAGALTPDIAANSKTQVTPYDTTPVNVQAPKITAFSNPTNPSLVAAPSNGQVGAGIFTMSDRRKKDALVPTGA